MESRLAEQAALLNQAVVYLVKLYQFRDRNEICAYGISVTQCYALEALITNERLSVSALAKELRVTDSTTSRVIDQLIAKGLAERETSRHDRRVSEVYLTDEGRQLVDTIWSGFRSREMEILQHIPENSRDHVIWAIQQLGAAAEDVRQAMPET